MNYQQIFDSLAPLFGFVSDNLAYGAREAVRVTSGCIAFNEAGQLLLVVLLQQLCSSSSASCQ